MPMRELTNQEIELVSRQINDAVDKDINPHFLYLDNLNRFIAWKRQNQAHNLNAFEKRFGAAIENQLVSKINNDPNFREHKFMENIPAFFQFIKDIIQDFKSNLGKPGIKLQDRLFLEYLNHIENLCRTLVIIMATKDKVKDSAGIESEIGADHLKETLSAISPAKFPPALAKLFDVEQIRELPTLPGSFEYLHTEVFSNYSMSPANGIHEPNHITESMANANSRITQTFVAEFLKLCRDTTNNDSLTAAEKSKIICDFVETNLDTYSDLYHAALLKLSKTYDFTDNLNIPEETAKQLQQILSNFTAEQHSRRSGDNEMEFAMKLMTDLINSDHWRSKSGRSITPGAIDKLRNVIKTIKYFEYESPEVKQSIIKMFCENVNRILLKHMNKKSPLRDEMTKDFYEIVSEMSKQQDTTKTPDAFLKLKEMHYLTIEQPREILGQLKQLLAAPEWRNITPGISKLQSILQKSFAGGMQNQNPLKVLRELAQMSDLFTKPTSDHFSATKINDINNPLSRELHAKLKKLYSTPYDQAARKDLLDYISQGPAQPRQEHHRGAIHQ